jgi:hypothetical protein
MYTSAARYRCRSRSTQVHIEREHKLQAQVEHQA